MQRVNAAGQQINVINEFKRNAGTIEEHGIVRANTEQITQYTRPDNAVKSKIRGELQMPLDEFQKETGNVWSEESFFSNQFGKEATTITSDVKAMDSKTRITTIHEPNSKRKLALYDIDGEGTFHHSAYLNGTTKNPNLEVKHTFEVKTPDRKLPQNSIKRTLQLCLSDMESTRLAGESKGKVVTTAEKMLEFGIENLTQSPGINPIVLKGLPSKPSMIENALTFALKLLKSVK